MTYKITHETSFEYANLVTFSQNLARLKPKNNHHQYLKEYELLIDPLPYEMNEFVDYFENTNRYIVIREPHKKLTLKATMVVVRDCKVITEERAKVTQASLSYEALKARIITSVGSDNEAKLYLFPTNLIPLVSYEIVLYVLQSFQSNRPVFESVYEFMGRIFEDFQFVSGFSDITTPIETIFREKKGVCQDFAQFAIGALRTIGIPARYVSGYIRTYPKEGEERLFGTDASHAWFGVYIPDIGWIDFDPTNNKIPNEEYIVLGYGRDYHDIAPLKGVVRSSGGSQLKVSVDVAPLIFT